MAVPAWALDLWMRVQPYAERLAVWRGYENELETLAILGIGIAVYTALVFAFYNAISRRRPIHFRFSDGGGWAARGGRFVERALAFPLVSFLYFTLLAVALIVLAKNQPVQQILLFSMAVVVGVRVTVYLNARMSNDLAKLVPLSLLGVVLVDPGYLRLSDAWVRLVEAVNLWPLLGRYFVLFIAQEIVMSTGRWIVLKARSKSAWAQKHTPSPKAETDEPMFTLDVKAGSLPFQKR